MKKIMILAVMTVFSLTLFAQQKEDNTQTVAIMLPRYCCAMEHPVIENALAYTKGVESWQINPQAKSVMVTFNADKTSQMKIEKALAKAGIETPNCKANKRAIEKLPGCCKATAKGEAEGMGAECE